MSKDSITLGLSSASIAATGNQLSLLSSPSSSTSFSPAVPRASVSVPSVFSPPPSIARAVAGAVSSAAVSVAAVRVGL